jgi:hypothetical protein
LICFVIPQLLGQSTVKVASEFEQAIDDTDLRMLAKLVMLVVRTYGN